MYIYGMSSAGQDLFGVDELFDFSDDRDDLFSSSTTTETDIFHNITSSTASGSQFLYAFNNNNNNNNTTTTNYHHSTDFTDHFCVPSDGVAELEWLSKFVDDSFSDFPANNIAGTINFRPENTSFHSRSRSKRTRAPSDNKSWTSIPVPTTPFSETSKTKRETYSSTTSSSCDKTSEAGVVTRCTHCASEKTPQWRTGPLGPQTLCNACGVRMMEVLICAQDWLRAHFHKAKDCFLQLEELENGMKDLLLEQPTIEIDESFTMLEDY